MHLSHVHYPTNPLLRIVILNDYMTLKNFFMKTYKSSDYESKYIDSREKNKMLYLSDTK